MKFVLKDCEIIVSYYCFTLVAASFITDITTQLLICLLCACVHEFGHVAALLVFTGKFPRSITVTPFGINIISDGGFNTTTFQRILISLSGPTVNLIAFIAFSHHLNGFLALQNLALGVFNLLPIIPLDGGCILSELLSLKFNCEKSNLIAEIISVIFIIPIFSVGFVMIFNNPYNYFLLFIACYLIFLFVLRNKH